MVPDSSDTDASTSNTVGVDGPLSWQAFAGAFRQLTILGSAPASDKPGRALLWYPLVGLVFGLMWLAVDLIVAPLGGHWISSVAVASIGLLITRRWPCIGLGMTLRSLWSGSRQNPDGEVPATVSVALVAALVWLIQLACLASVDRWRPIGLVCAPLFGRWAMVVLAFGSRQSRPDGKRMKYAKGVTFEEFGWASTATLGLVFWATGLLGILLLICAAIPIVGLRVWLHWRLDGVTTASLGAACAIAEIVPLAVLAGFSSAG